MDLQCEVTNTKHDVVYSSDEGGWYLSRYPDGKTSQLFDSKELALGALENHHETIRWD